MINKKRSAFTLMEMLLVVTLTAMIGLTIFGTFNNGLKLWAYGVRLDREADASFLLGKLGDDLRSAVSIDKIKYNGIGSRFSFPAIVLTPADRNGSLSDEGLISQIGAVQYSFDFSDGTVYRRQANYSQSLKGQWGEARAIAFGLEDVTFRYHFRAEKEIEVRSQIEGGAPFGVEIEFHIKKDGFDHEFKHFFLTEAGG